MNLKLPEELQKKLENKIKETDFKSVEEYVLYILNQVTESNLKEETSKEEAVAYTPEEEKELKDRLDEMGYI